MERKQNRFPAVFDFPSLCDGHKQTSSNLFMTLKSCSLLFSDPSDFPSLLSLKEEITYL